MAHFDELLKPLDYFASLVQAEDDIPLFEAALSIAHDDDPSMDLNQCLLEVDKFAIRLQRRLPADIAPIPKLRLLNNFFIKNWGLLAISMITTTQITVICTKYSLTGVAYPFHLR
mgnify:CR=1 FL=1